MKNVFLFILTIALLGLSNGNASAQRANEYPNMSLMMTNGSIKNAKELPGSSVLIIYFPDCDHCQREATEISKHLKSFEKRPVWFISTASFADIDNFARQYKLAGYDNIHFVRTDIKDVINNFGGIPTPSVFIYSKEKQLVKAFKGETKIEEIIKYL
ncbi:MAG: redoxin domain-containing protein [Bacteroidetes bacterium]|nr:redoxin domain-containing protein [Bacteroidota bacterium]